MMSNRKVSAPEFQARRNECVDVLAPASNARTPAPRAQAYVYATKARIHCQRKEMWTLIGFIAADNIC
jgi:hypothetical protein